MATLHNRYSEKVQQKPTMINYQRVTTNGLHTYLLVSSYQTHQCRQHLHLPRPWLHLQDKTRAENAKNNNQRFSIKIREGLVYDHFSTLSSDDRHLVSNANNALSKGLTVLLSWITEAVRPAADDPFPEV